jgi:hypothetical protein
MMHDDLMVQDPIYVQDILEGIISPLGSEFRLEDPRGRASY